MVLYSFLCCICYLSVWHNKGNLKINISINLRTSPVKNVEICCKTIEMTVVFYLGRDAHVDRKCVAKLQVGAKWLKIISSLRGCH